MKDKTLGLRQSRLEERGPISRRLVQWSVAGFAPFVLAQISPDRVRAEDSDQARDIRSACHAPPPADTTGWQVERLLSKDGWHFFFRLPSTFKREPKAGFAYWGWPSYTDGRRRVWNGSDYFCAPEPDAPCSECIDTLAGHPFTIVSSYKNGLYNVAATRLPKGGVSTAGLHLTSPNPSDQDLLLAIVRTLEERSRTSTSGTLFFGGHGMKPPFVFTCPDGRLTVNGYWLPDLIPPTSRQPTANGELEARKTIAARLAAQRDSLLEEGVEWPEVQKRMKVAALKNPFVTGVQSSFQAGSTFTVSWAFGYDVTLLSATSGKRPLTMGGRRQTFEEDWHFWTARLDYLKALLDKGSAVFLLGGGCEYVVDPAEAAQVTRAARQTIQGQTSGILPPDVQEQLRKPLSIERAQ